MKAWEETQQAIDQTRRELTAVKNLESHTCKKLAAVRTEKDQLRALLCDLARQYKSEGGEGLP